MSSHDDDHGNAMIWRSPKIHWRVGTINFPMPNMVTNYIVYTPWHRRRHVWSQTQLVPSVHGTVAVGDIIPVTAFSELPYMGNTLPFAFMAVAGAADGTHLYTSPWSHNISVWSQDIKVLVVYAPVWGGGWTGGPWILIDAFNVDICDFSDSDFVQVYTDGVLSAPKTAVANDDGFVSSTTAEDIRSFSSVDGAPFQEWKKIGSTSITNLDYMLERNESGIAFAFYKSPSRMPIPNIGRHIYDAGWIYVSPWVLVDGGGFVIGPNGPHPVDPWGPLRSQLMSTLALLSISSNMSKGIKEQAVKLASENLAALSKEIRSFKGLEK